MILENFNNEKTLASETVFLREIAEKLEEVKFEVLDRLSVISKDKDGLYYVYSYTPEKIYITKKGSEKLELLENVSKEFKNNLAEGFILRCENGKFIIDEELTEKSMKFELDFDKFKEL